MRFLFPLALVALEASAAAVPLRKRSYPFNQIVAFGDELSDNGNGSYAHGITGSPASVYGFNTWTDGPVAVSYLADLLGVPLVDYAFGAGPGGGAGGATLNNTYTPADATWNGKPVPSLYDQIHNNYTLQPNNNIQNSIQFIWIGLNDVSKHTDAFWLGDPQNAAFAQQYATQVLSEAEYLVQQGAPLVFIANIYPKNLAPVTTIYLCQDGSCVDTWGIVIQQANAALGVALKASPYAKKFIYHDTYGFLSTLASVKQYFGLTAPFNEYCDGDPAVAQWDACIAGPPVWNGAKKFFWMNFVQMTTGVHQFLAEDMYTLINMHMDGTA